MLILFLELINDSRASPLSTYLNCLAHIYLRSFSFDNHYSGIFFFWLENNKYHQIKHTYKTSNRKLNLSGIEFRAREKIVSFF